MSDAMDVLVVTGRSVECPGCGATVEVPASGLVPDHEQLCMGPRGLHRNGVACWASGRPHREGS